MKTTDILLFILPILGTIAKLRNGLSYVILKGKRNTDIISPNELGKLKTDLYAKRT